MLRIGGIRYPGSEVWTLVPVGLRRPAKEMAYVASNAFADFPGRLVVCVGGGGGLPMLRNGFSIQF